MQSLDAAIRRAKDRDEPQTVAYGYSESECDKYWEHVTRSWSSKTVVVIKDYYHHHFKCSVVVNPLADKFPLFRPCC